MRRFFSFRRFAYIFQRLSIACNPEYHIYNKQNYKFIQCILTHINCLFSHFMIEILDKFLFGVVQKSISISVLQYIWFIAFYKHFLTKNCCVINGYMVVWSYLLCMECEIHRYKKPKAACLVCCFTTSSCCWPVCWTSERWYYFELF